MLASRLSRAALAAVKDGASFMQNTMKMTARIGRAQMRKQFLQPMLLSTVEDMTQATT